MTLSDVKQALLNVSAVTLYCLFEQQLLYFLRHEILHPSERNNDELISAMYEQNRFKHCHLTIAWSRIWQIAPYTQIVRRQCLREE